MVIWNTAPQPIWHIRNKDHHVLEVEQSNQCKALLHAPGSSLLPMCKQVLFLVIGEKGIAVMSAKIANLLLAHEAFLTDSQVGARDD